MKTASYILTLFAIIVCASLSARANNVQVSSVTLVGQNTTNDYCNVQFTVSWENSWTNGPGGNHDAVWVFVKYRVPISSGGDNTWRHAKLHNDGHSYGGSSGSVGLVTPGGTFDASTNYGVGVMLPATGSATSLSNVQLRWNYGVCLETGTGTDYVDAGDQVEVRVFAIEMVYVPGGVDFAVGNTGSESNKFTLTTINTASATTAPSGGGSKGGSAGGYPSGQTAPSSASWPNGYNAFYCMKYEISQGQYRDFLNTLTYNQQATRTGSPPNSPVGSPANYMSVRCGTQIMTSGVSNTVPAVYGSDYNGNKSWNEINDGEWIAQGALSWADGAAYADWAGLRPMTEMEYEKACRGTENAVANEYAWGDASISQADTIITHPGANDEIASSGANAVHGNDTNGPTGGPLRVGVFAKSNTTRAQSGASYWGIMELSGNLFELCVTIGNVAGRSFMGVTGNGMLTAAGDADVDYWPGINGNSTVDTANGTYNGGFGVTQAAGSGYRGGNWKLTSPYLRVSDRATAAGASNVRLNTYGFRGVR